ncbi:hypothetical protein KY289_036393 [Solanum tuberosum]|nr:hypothetical protein KY289_036393 [Solanum tuberosum]
MALGETSENSLDMVTYELQKVIDEYNKLAQEKKDWQILLEASQIEVNLLTKELEEIKLQLNSIRKSLSHSSEQSKKTYKKGMWVLDNGCSKHMCGKKENFKTIKKIDGGFVRFGDNAKGESQVILGYGIENLDTQITSAKRSTRKEKSFFTRYSKNHATRSKSPEPVLGKSVSTACHILNRCLIRPILKKTPYEIWRGKNNLGYAPSSRAFLVFNKRTLSVEEFVHVVFDDTNPRVQEIEVGDDETASFNQSEAISEVITETNTEELATAEVESTTPVDKTNIPGNGDIMQVILKTSFWENQMIKFRQDLLFESKPLWPLYLKWSQNE